MQFLWYYIPAIYDNLQLTTKLDKIFNRKKESRNDSANGLDKRFD